MNMHNVTFILRYYYYRIIRTSRARDRVRKKRAKKHTHKNSSRTTQQIEYENEGTEILRSMVIRNVLK